jgi:hypothetical protein
MATVRVTLLSTLVDRNSATCEGTESDSHWEDTFSSHREVPVDVWGHVTRDLHVEVDSVSALHRRLRCQDMLGRTRELN